MGKNYDLDWERIELQYRQGILSLQEICAYHNDDISLNGLIAHANANGWERNLSAQIQARADAILCREEVERKAAPPEKPAPWTKESAVSKGRKNTAREQVR